MTRTAVFFAVLLSMLVGACSSGVTLPDRADEAVQVEEARIAAVLESTDDVWIPGTCAVRLLGLDETTSYVWARCEETAGENSPEGSGLSGPFRIDGDRVTEPGDGSLYADGVRELFPPNLADVILDPSRREDVLP